jgi:acyl-CoA thioesterase FadM
MTLEQLAIDPGNLEVVFAHARVVLVWVGPSGRPIRIPDEVREALQGTGQ